MNIPTREELLKRGFKTRFKADPITEKALRLAGLVSVRQICDRFKISETKLRSAAVYRKISLAFDRPLTFRKKWDLDEIRNLKELAGFKCSAEIGIILNRSESSVKSKACSIGLSLLQIGENSSSSKYSNHDIELCRLLDEEGLTPTEISTKMEIELSHLCKVLKYKSRIRELGAVA